MEQKIERIFGYTLLISTFILGIIITFILNDYFIGLSFFLSVLTIRYIVWPYFMTRLGGHDHYDYQRAKEEAEMRRKSWE